MTARIKIVQNDLIRPNLNFHEFRKILALKVTKEPNENVAEQQLDNQGFIPSTDRG